MRTAATLVIAIVYSLVAQSSAAPTPAEPVATMEQCAKLLPQGRRYTFSISGTIDYTDAAPILHGELSLANDTNDNLTHEAGPFAQCFAKLVR